MAAPFGDCEGLETLEKRFLKPLRSSFPGLPIDPEILIADRFDDHIWVAVMGRIQADQRATFAWVPPGPKRTLRLGLFFQFENNLVCKLRVLTDLPDLAKQAGFELLPSFQGRTSPIPPPENSAAMNKCRADPVQSQKSREIVAQLIGGLNRLRDGSLTSMRQDHLWDDEMRWYGPWGIGTCHGFDEYQRFAQGPSVASFPNRRGSWPKEAFVAEGCAAAFTGWPSLIGDFTGKPFRGVPPTDGPIGQNIMDFYTIKHGKLHENWVFIDLIEFASQCGVDLLQPLKQQSARA